MSVVAASESALPDLSEQILIAGAGAVGLTMGVALARAGRAVTIVEGGPRTPGGDYLR